MIRELVSTEQTYVKRLRILKQDYADPLRNFSKKKEEALLDKYKAKTLFGNIDQLIPVNEAFLHDLEKMIGPSGQRLVGGVGDVCLKHFRDKRAFDCYNLYFAKREEALAIFEEEATKGGKSGFAAYIDRIKYSSADVRNRLGLRELLAEPIQRIPRYTMMWQNIIKEMDESDPQRAKLMEAERIASKIASCESDDQTKRATTMYCLERTIEGFPPGLISNGRRFVDCIDVEDMPVETQPISSGASVSSGGLGALHCTLFLFDDRLIIVKRPNGASSGRTLARLGEVEKLLRTNALNTLKKSGMSCKGVVDILDITATDAAGPDLHLYLENPPEDQTDRWNGRPFRSYAVVLPPSPLNLDPTATDAAKRRFLENLWTVQALYRVKNGRCIALRSEEKQVGSRAGQTTVATAYYNVYQRNPYLGEPKKPKVVVHIDPSRRADAIPFGVVSGPFVVIRLQPMEGALCRYNVTCTSPDEEEEEDIVHTDVVPSRIMQTIHQFGLFSFRTGAISRPNTPTASTRSRAAIFGLDVISRTLMGTTRGRNNELFSFGASMSGTLSGTGKSRGVMSRTSTQTMSTALTESTNRFSYRSTSTAATSFLGDDSMMGKSSLKLSKGKAAGLAAAAELENSESPQDDTRRAASFDNSERDLSMRLELAKRNGLSHRATRSEDVSFLLRDPPFAETIYEEEPPPSKVTPDRRRRRDDAGDADSDYRPDSVTPTKGTPSKPLPGIPRGPSGPRNSLAPPKLTDMPAYDYDIETALDETIAAFSPPHGATHISDDENYEPEPPIFQPLKSAAVTRTPTRDSTASVEPLSIKKKSSIKPRRSPGSFRRIHAPETPSPSQTTKHAKRAARTPPRRRSSGKGKQVERIVVVAKTTREDVRNLFSLNSGDPC
ncbi:hypothetical protein CPB86DRAFT_702137 [Serendipita vermifera]|nr:hypothetical protein CPB86DRAFT_702137 [Serendipita vermifera]